jgi:DNA repair protein SbcD/Mre11
MKILHTADWHLGDRLGRIDRTADLRRAVERVAGYCERERAEVLLLAGDLFSELSRPDGLRDSIAHLQEVFTPFLANGGTIVALTGNHDNEIFCQTLRHAMALAAPAVNSAGGPLPGRRLYLAAGPTLLRLEDRSGQPVQFVLMPYPTPPRYLDEPGQHYGSLEEKNRALQAAYTTKLTNILERGTHYDPRLPTVLAAHIHVQGGKLPSLFRMSERESIIFSAADVPGGLAYVALGHIHNPQCPAGEGHVRYCGSIERLDLGERTDDKGVVVVDIGPEGRRGEPAFLPLDATPMYDLDFVNPTEQELAGLPERYPDHERALVRYRLVWTAGVHNREALLRQLDDLFPRWYDREVHEASVLGRPLTGPESAPTQRGFAETVRGYLETELMNHAEDERAAVLRLAEALLAEEEPA